MIRIKHIKRIVLEAVIYISIISIIMALFAFLYSQFCETAKYIIVQADLRNLNIALEVYKYKTGKYPYSLRQLIVYFSAKDDENNLGLIFPRIDKKGYPLDPFNNRYIYDKESFTITLSKSCVH